MKRTISLLLSLIIILSLFSGLSVSAADTGYAEPSVGSGLDSDLGQSKDDEDVPDPFFVPIYALEDELLPEDAAEEDFVAIMDEVASLVQTIPEYVQGSLTVSDEKLSWQSADGTPYYYYPYYRALNRPGEKAGVSSEGECGVCDYSTGEEICYTAESADLIPSDRKEDTDLAATGAYYNGPMSRHIAVIEPEYGQPGDFTCDGQPLEEKGKKLAKYTGGTYSYATGSKVTIDFIIDAIKGCGVVMINTHGNIDNFQIRSKKGLEGHSGWAKTGDDEYIILSACLDEMLGSYTCPNNFVMLVCCRCMGDNSFGSVLLRHGVAAVYGLSQNINHYGDLDYAKAICERLDDGKTLSQAIAGTKRDKGYFDPYKYKLRSYDADVAEAFGSSTEFSAPRALYKIYAKYNYHDIDENSLSWNPWAQYCSDFLKQRRPDVDPYNWKNLKAISDAFKSAINKFPKKYKCAFPVVVSAVDPYPDDPDSVQDVHTDWRLPKKSEDIGFGDSQAEVIHKTLMYDIDDFYSGSTLKKDSITLPLPDYSSQGYYVQFVSMYNDAEMPRNMYWANEGTKSNPVLKLNKGTNYKQRLYGVAFKVRYWNYAEAKYIYKFVCFHILLYREYERILSQYFTITADGSNEQTITLRDIRDKDSKYFRTITFLGSPPAGMRLYGGWGDGEWQGLYLADPDADKAPYLKGIAATPGSYYARYQIFDTNGNMYYSDVKVSVLPKKTVSDTMSVKMTGGTLSKYPIKVKVDNTDKTDHISSVELKDSDGNNLPDGIDIGEENGVFYLYGTLDNPRAGKQHEFTLEVTLDDGTLVNLLVTLTEPCRVTFDLNGHGTGLPRDQWIELNGRVKKPADPSASNSPRTFTGFYTFKGWYTDENCTELFDFNTVLSADYLSNVSGSLTLYAGWEEFKGIEVFGWKKSASEGSSKINLSDITQEDFNSFDNLIREGYTFKGWSANGHMTEVVSKFKDCLASQSGKQKLSAYACFTKNPTKITLDLPESAEPGDVIELKAAVEPWDAQTDITWTVSSPYVAVSDGKLYISAEAGYKDEIEVTAEAAGKSASAVIYLMPEDRFLRITDHKNGTEVEVTEADSDIIGNGVFSFDGDRTLTISGDGVTLEEITVDAGFEKGLNIVVEGDVTFIVRDDPVLNLSGDVTLTGGAMHISCIRKCSAESMISFMGSGITLTVADMTLTAEGRVDGISSVKGVNSLKVRKADLDINSTEGFAVIGLSGGVELTDCELRGGDGVLIGSDGVYKDSDNPASHVVIKATAGEKVTLSGTVYYPSGEPMGNTMIRIAGQVTKTDAMGRYTLKNIPAGEHVMEISEPSGFTVDKTVEVTPSAPADPEDPQQEEHVANADIKPFETALVTFMPGYGEGESYTVEAAYNETFELPECTFIAPEGMKFDCWDLGYPGDYIDIDGDITAVAVFKNGGHVHNMSYIAGTDADCEHGGTLSAYYCEYCGKYFLTGDGSIEIGSDLSIEPLGHIWELVEWTWADDYSTAWASFVCSADNSHTITVEADQTEAFDVTDMITDFAEPLASATEYVAIVVLQGQYYDDIVQEFVTAKHFVDFDLGGHGEDLDSDTEPLRVTGGSKISKPVDPTASGWMFEGWYSDAECTVEFDFDAPILRDTVVYGKWSESKALLGDADADGEVTILDATAIQRYLASLPNPTFFEPAADADEDGEVTILDATAIQRHLASLSSNPNIGKAKT